jgi:hypothetical protein
MKSPNVSEWSRAQVRMLVVLAIVIATANARGSQEQIGTILGCAPRALVGETVCVCGRFPDPAPVDGFRIDGRAVQVVSSNPTNVKLQLPPDLAPGPHAITGAGGITGRAVVEVVAPRVWLEVTRLQFTQQTHVHVAAEGTRTSLMVRLTNANPEIVTLAGGDEQRLPTNGGTPNEVPPREVKAGASPGKFVIHAEIEVGACPCGLTPPTGAGSAGGSVGKPPGAGGGGGIPPPTGGTGSGGGVPPPGGDAPPGARGTNPPRPPSSTPPGTQPPPLGVLLERDDDNWIPAAEVQASCPPSGGTPATTLTARLYEFTEEGWAPTEQKRPITIRFTGRSKEKGRALNMPVLSGPEQGPDLYFPAPANAAFACADDPTGGNTFFGRCTTKPEVNETRITVQAADFGGFGVTDAMCPGCVQLVKFRGSIVQRGSAGTATRFGANLDVSVPKDDNRNGIADAARMWERADPAEDLDDVPQSDWPGDGITAYEEYRGFYVAGCHVRTDPAVKDLFVANPGFDLNLFRTASGLMVWELWAPKEWRDADRVVNFNRGHALLVAQHGLRLLNRQTKPGIAGFATTYGPPRRVHEVVIEGNRGTADTVAHELGHAVGMYHHGEIATEEIGPPAGYVPASGSVLKPGQKIKLGHVGDQGSGHYSCIMRYPYHGDIVADASAPGGYCAISPPMDFARTLFCSSNAGTGPNANGRCQGSARVGNCKAQLVVSDIW